MSNLPGLKFRQTTKYFWHQRMCIFKTIRFGSQDNDCKRKIFELLLMRQIFIHREKNIEVIRIGDQTQELSVFDASPSGAWNGLNVVAGQLQPQTRGQTFIEKNSHLGDRQHPFAGFFEEGNGLFAGHGWKILQKNVE